MSQKNYSITVSSQLSAQMLGFGNFTEGKMEKRLCQFFKHSKDLLTVFLGLSVFPTYAKLEAVTLTFIEVLLTRQLICDAPNVVGQSTNIVLDK